MRWPVGLVVALAWAVALGCSGAPRRPAAQLRVVAQPENARVYVNDRFLATARVIRQRPEVLRTGVHHMTVTAPGHFPHDVELDLPEGLTTVEISLRPIPP
ncbi:MAG: hypothetical protein AAGF12_19105 [Myxococcota bacterium]